MHNRAYFTIHYIIFTCLCQGRNYLDENIKHAHPKVNTSVVGNKDKEKKPSIKAKYISPFILDAQRKARERAKKSKGNDSNIDASITLHHYHCN